MSSGLLNMVYNALYIAIPRTLYNCLLHLELYHLLSLTLILQLSAIMTTSWSLHQPHCWPELSVIVFSILITLYITSGL